MGVNFDFDLRAARRAIEAQGLDWPQVMAPTDRELHRLWSQAIGVTDIPRLLLVAREGILRADVKPDELALALENLMDQR